MQSLLLLTLILELHRAHALQVDEQKGRLTEVISNCETSCKRIATEGPESLHSSIKPFTATFLDERTSSVSSFMQESNQLSQQKSQFFFPSSICICTFFLIYIFCHKINYKSCIDQKQYDNEDLYLIQFFSALSKGLKFVQD